MQLEEQSAQKKVLTLQQGGTSHKIGIIEIPTFYVDFKAVQNGDPDYKSTTRDVHALIDQLKAEGVEGIIIDLRNNGGGSLQEADSLTGLFIKSGPTVQVKTANRRAQHLCRYRRRDRMGRSARGDGESLVRIRVGNLRRRDSGLRPRSDHRQPDIRQGHGADADSAESRPAEDHAGEVLSRVRPKHATPGRTARRRVPRGLRHRQDRREFARRRDAVGRNQTGRLPARNAGADRAAGAGRQTPRPRREQPRLRISARVDGQEPREREEDGDLAERSGPHQREARRRCVASRHREQAARRKRRTAAEDDRGTRREARCRRSGRRRRRQRRRKVPKTTR